MKNKHPFHTLIRKFSYTLVELLVAVGVLALMMTFLFQFVISAQRVWSASANTSDSFASAQIIFDQISADLQNAKVAQDTPLYLKSDANGTESQWGFIAQNRSMNYKASDLETRVGLYPVLYVHKGGNLYRASVDKNQGSLHQFYPFYSSGLQYNDDVSSTVSTSNYDYFGQLFSNSSSPYNISDATKLEDNFDLLAENVRHFHVEFDTAPDSGTHYVKNGRPKAIRVTLILEEVPQKGTTTDNEPFYRSYTKIIFLK